MVDTDVSCIHFQHIEKSFSHLCHDSSLRSSSCHQLYDTKQRSLMGSCMVQSSTANLHEYTTPVSVRDMRWHSQLLVAFRSGKVLVEQWPPLRRQSAEAPSNRTTRLLSNWIVKRLFPRRLGRRSNAWEGRLVLRWIKYETFRCELPCFR